MSLYDGFSKKSSDAHLHLQALERRANGTNLVAHLTKREFFAAMALQSAITLPWAQGNPDQAADVAVSFADKLLHRLKAEDSERSEMAVNIVGIRSVIARLRQGSVHEGHIADLLEEALKGC